MVKKDKLWTRDFISISITYFLVACSFNLLMPTIPIYLSEELGVEPSKIGIVLSTYAIALLFIRPFSGFWVDAYSRKPLLFFGVILFVATYIGYYFAFTVLFFVILRFIHGMFWGLSSVSMNTVAIDLIPSSRRAEGVGYFGVNMNIAMAVAPYIAVWIYETYSFQILITCALGMGILSIIALFFIHVPIRPRIDEVPPISLDRFILIKGIPILINQLFIAFGWGTLAAFAVLYGKESGISNSGIFFLFLAGGIVFSRVSTGKLIDRGFLHLVVQAAFLIIAFGYVTFALFDGIIWFCISAFFIGLGYGTLFPAFQTIYINMAPKDKRGTANSTYLTGFDLGIGAGMLLGAYLVQYFNYSNMYFISGILSFVAFFIYIYNSIPVFERNRMR